MKAAELFVQALVQEGVKYIFAVPGEENLEMLESLANHPEIKLILTRHEQAAGFMAATLGRLTGHPGVCLSTLGPGATNFVTASAYAQLGGMPMMMITGQKPIKKSKQGKFQILNTVDIFLPVTKYSKQLVNGDSVSCQVREAFRLAMQERPGAVHLELPEDVAEEETQVPLFEVTRSPIPQASQSSLDEALHMIEAAKRPLILVGAAANRKRICEALQYFVSKSGIYFFNTQMGKGVIDETQPLFLGTASLSEGDFVHRAIEHADLIINVGHDVIEKPPFIMTHGGVKVIHINFFAAHMDGVYFPQVEVVGDMATTMSALATAITPQSHWDFDLFGTIKRARDEQLKEKCDDTQFPILPQRLVKDVREAMPVEGILTLDNGLYKLWFSRNYHACRPNTLLLDNALATMGAGLPSAIAAKIIHPEKPVMAVCGDGGFMMNSQELETAVRLNLHLIVLILKDNAYGMIKWKQANMHLKNYGLDFNNPDFVQYAQSYGATGQRVESTEAFLPLLKNCLITPAVHVIEVPIDYTQSGEDLGERLKASVATL